MVNQKEEKGRAAESTVRFYCKNKKLLLQKFEGFWILGSRKLDLEICMFNAGLICFYVMHLSVRCSTGVLIN